MPDPVPTPAISERAVELYRLYMEAAAADGHVERRLLRDGLRQVFEAAEVVPVAEVERLTAAIVELHTAIWEAAGWPEHLGDVARWCREQVGDEAIDDA